MAIVQQMRVSNYPCRNKYTYDIDHFDKVHLAMTSSSNTHNTIGVLKSVCTNAFRFKAGFGLFPYTIRYAGRTVSLS